MLDVVPTQTHDMDTELSYRKCVELLRGTTVGRCAFCTPEGPVIVPVNHRVIDDSIVIRTTPLSQLGTRGWSSLLAYEVDGVDVEARSGWSVVANGPGSLLDDPDELAFVRTFHDPEPWASGPRFLYVRLRWRTLSGRRVGAGPVLVNGKL